MKVLTCYPIGRWPAGGKARHFDTLRRPLGLDTPKLHEAPLPDLDRHGKFRRRRGRTRRRKQDRASDKSFRNFSPSFGI